MTVGRDTHSPNPPSSLNPHRQLDCLGLFCPIPIVKTREAMKGMAVGEVLEMLSDDPASDADMKSWALRTGNELMAVSKDGVVHRFLIRKVK